MALSLPAVRVVRPPTAGPWFDRARADAARREYFPPTAPRTPTVFMLDLNSVYPSADVLEAFVLPLAYEIKAGRHGQATLVVSTGNEGLRKTVEALAINNHLPLYVAPSPSPVRLGEAAPAGEVTATERETLEAIAAMGGRTNATQLADRLNLQHTAASNRLVSLVSKGYLYRVNRPGRDGDIFVDPRFPSLEQAVDSILTAAKDAMSTDEYQRTERLLRRTIAPNTEPDSGPSSY